MRGFDLDALKAAYEAGHYRTEADEDQQEGFPWQNKTCKDCSFWFSSACGKHDEYRSPISQTCISFVDRAGIDAEGGSQPNP